MGHIQREPGRSRAGLGPQLPHVMAPKNLHARLAWRQLARHGLAAAAFAVQKVLHKGQKSHELLVMPLMKMVGRAGVLVHHLPPGAGGRTGAQQLPRAAGRARLPGRGHEAQGPKQNLMKTPHHRCLITRRHGQPHNTNTRP